MRRHCPVCAGKMIPWPESPDDYPDDIRSLPGFKCEHCGASFSRKDWFALPALLDSSLDKAAETAGMTKQQVAENTKLREWAALSDQALRLRCGELTAGELRTIRAVLKAIMS